MNVFVQRYNPDIKRLRTFVDRSEGIQWWTHNNLYPQIVEGIRDRSYTIKSACDRLQKFLRGEGFEDPSLAGLVVNQKGQTLQDVLRMITIDAATYSGSFVVHLGVNLLGEYNNLSVWPMAYWRFGLPDENGDVFDYKFNSNWEQDPYKEISNAKRILEYPKFIPDKELIKSQIEEWSEKRTGYPGQVYFVTPLEDQYPLATFDTVLDQGQTQEEIGIFRLSSIQNGLNAANIFSYPGKFENKQKEQEFVDGLNPFKGGHGAGSTIVIEDESGLKKAEDLITPLTLQNNDKIHEFISKDDKNAIMEAFAMPKGILGVLPETGMFNQQQLEEEYYYYNSITRDFRTDISSALKKIFSNWYRPVESDFKIKELVYKKQSTTVTSPSAPTEQAAVNDNLKNLTGKQLQNIQRVVRKFNKGELTFAAASQLLKNGYSFTEQDVNDWLVEDGEEMPNNIK